MNEENKNVDINQKNKEEYEKLMEESATNLDGYWDKNNPFVKILLLVLALIIIAGAIYYAMMYFG